ncbi:hypothetical protein Tco_0448686 [Tanacetum coccineum]
MDVKTAFLYGPLKKIVRNKTDGFVDHTSWTMFLPSQESNIMAQQATKSVEIEILFRESSGSQISSCGGDKLVSWSSKKQDCTSMSSAEAEYVLPHSHLVNPGQHSIPKTYDVRFSLHKKQVEKWYCRIILCRTDNTMLADLFTKALSEDRFKYLVRRLDCAENKDWITSRSQYIVSIGFGYALWTVWEDRLDKN